MIHSPFLPLNFGFFGANDPPGAEAEAPLEGEKENILRSGEGYRETCKVL